MIQQIKGLLATTVFVTNTVVMVSVLLLFAVFKLLLPVTTIRVVVSKILVWIAESWIQVNSTAHRWIHGNKIIVDEMPKLSKDQWYLVVANHQSTVDIPVLQAVFNKKIPFLKFFLKQELIWVPFLGLAWWALDFPFMKRYSRETLAKKPHLKGKDMEQTQKSCEKFKYFPTTVINFVEGTRFTQIKQQQQNSPYQYLLKPKAGGIGFVMGAMGSQMRTLLLVTVAYPQRVPTVWQYLCGNFKAAHVRCEKTVIPEALLNKNYQKEKNLSKFIHWERQMVLK